MRLAKINLLFGLANKELIKNYGKELDMMKEIVHQSKNSNYSEFMANDKRNGL